MTKSYVKIVQGLYHNILADIGDQYPSLSREFERDYSRLSSALEHHGLRFATIDLVAYGKHFDKCLSHQRLDYYRGTHLAPFSNRTIIPRLFRGLLLRVFEIDGCLRSDADVQAIKYLRQLYYAARKLDMECADERVFREVSSFYDTDRSCRLPTLDWAGEGFVASEGNTLALTDCYNIPISSTNLELLEEVDQEGACDRRLLERCQLVADIVCSRMGTFDPNEHKFRHGRGAVSDLRPGVSKYSFPSWSERLESVFPYATFAFANEGIWAQLSQEGLVQSNGHEPPSKLISVPKTQKAPRLIASEPTSSQWCQQAILGYLAEAVKFTPLMHCVSFSDQGPNGELALRASHSGSHWTIDLSAASDRVSCWLVERIFRRNSTLLTALWATRTRSISNSIDKKHPQVYDLRKFSTMGSACTFPIQTYIFSIIAIAALVKGPVNYRSVSEAARNVRVFGDDIIVPSHSGSETVRLLTTLGLRVNTDKTFSTGKFRESCGTDAFDGHIVTPVYFRKVPNKSRPESINSAIEVRNNYYRNGYFRTASWLLRLVRKQGSYTFANVRVGSGSFGLESFSPDNVHLSKRYNERLQRVEAHVTTVKTGIRRADDHWYSRLLQYFTEAPDPLTKWESGIPGRPRTTLVRRWVEWDPNVYGSYALRKA